ncbi:MAG: hypothetical protein M5U35_00610 [Roseovarius sp.]|nr:hypothetical protein [Roseovarius sp.]
MSITSRAISILAVPSIWPHIELEPSKTTITFSCAAAADAASARPAETTAPFNMDDINSSPETIVSGAPNHIRRVVSIALGTVAFLVSHVAH